MAEGIPARLTTPAELRRFGLTVGGAFALLAAITWWREHPTLLRVFGTMSGLLVLGGLVAPAALGPVYRGWMGFAHLLSRITTPIFLGIVYFLVFTPVGVLRRLLGKDQLDRKPVEGSYFLPRAQKVSGSMDRLF